MTDKFVCPCCNGAGTISADRMVLIDGKGREATGVRPWMVDFIAAASRFYDINVRRIIGDQRTKEVVRARTAVSWLGYSRGYSNQQIANSLRQDHTSVVASRRRALKMMHDEAGFSDELKAINWAAYEVVKGRLNGERKRS